jgi:hypothetical protein
MKAIVRRAITGVSLALFTFTCLAVAQPMPKTTKEEVKGQADVKTEKLHGTVVFVEGNKLVVRMSTGDIRNFDVPDSRRFIVDGKELRVNELKPGTTLTATVTTTTTPVTERTTTIGTGKVWWVSGNTVIITLPNNENRQYKVSEAYRFTVEGKPASVHDLRRGMMISAQKIVEEPRTEMASNIAVTGQAPPPPEPVKTAQAAPAPEPQRPAPAPAPAAAAPAVAPTPAPVVEKAEAKLPARLPKTASPLPLIGLCGLMLMGASLVLRLLRRA